MKISEKFKLTYLKMYEDFNDKNIPNILKKYIHIIRKDILVNDNKSFKKNYNIDSININLNVNYIYGNKQPYYSNINIYDIITNEDKPIDLSVKVVDINIDIDYLLSVIIHEIRHIYDIYTINEDNDMDSFIKTLKLEQFKNTNYYTFIYHVYLSLEHELIARNNMIYPIFRWINIIDKPKLYEIYKQTFVCEALNTLMDFDTVSFIKSIPIIDLLKYTNQFITDVAKDHNICKNEEDLYIYYNKWESFFKEKSQEYINNIDIIFDDIILDIQNDVVYEHKKYEYNENIIGGVYKIFKSFYNKIFNI
jgi:hypothetical protein